MPRKFDAMVVPLGIAAAVLAIALLIRLSPGLSASVVGASLFGGAFGLALIALRLGGHNKQTAVVCAVLLTITGVVAAIVGPQHLGGLLPILSIAAWSATVRPARADSRRCPGHAGTI